MTMTDERPRLPVLDRDGDADWLVEAAKGPTVGWIGDYEVRVDPKDGPRLLQAGRVPNLYVLCPAELRTPDSWSYTYFYVLDGRINAADDDVILDPYHMCLLYQLVENLKERT
jgi:hypothetical protein